MSNFQILRVKKLKSKTAMTHAVNHNLRLGRAQSNIDYSKTHLNLVPSKMTALRDCNDRRDKALSSVVKIRKNAVLAHEFVIAASPEAINAGLSANYFADAYKFIVDLHNGAQNVISFAVHYDEKNVHAHVIVCPIVDNKLNSRAIIGGNKSRLSDLQTLFHKQVGSKYGLDRGEFGSKRKHTPLSKVDSTYDTKAAQLAVLDKEIAAKLQRSQKLQVSISEQENLLFRLDKQFVDSSKQGHSPNI